MLSPGDRAPDFKLLSTSGREVTLKSLRGKKVVLYFYPKDNTPGCTQESCDFRDAHARFEQAGADVLGVSKDSIASHERFRGKYSLPFELLSDPDNTAAQAYGAYGKKMMYGRPIVGTIRSTFVIDEQGRILARWSPVRVSGHADDVLAILEGRAAPESVQAKPAAKVKAKPASSAKKAPVKKAATKAKKVTKARVKKTAAR